MSINIKANRKGRSLCNYTATGLSFKGTTRRNTCIGQDCAQNRLNQESMLRNCNYDGREVKKCTTLSKAIALDKQKRKMEVSSFRARPGYIAEGTEAPSDAAPVAERQSVVSAAEEPTQAFAQTASQAHRHSMLSSRGTVDLSSRGTLDASAGRCTWIDTRAGQAPRQSDLQEPQFEQQPVEPQNAEPQLRHTVQMPVKLSNHKQNSQSQPLLSPQKAKSYSAGAQSQAALLSTPAARQTASPAKDPPAARRTASPGKDRPQEGPASPRVPPGSDTGSPGSAKGGISTMRSFTASTRSPRPGSVQSADLELSRLSQASLGGASQFGVGERLDVKKWSVVNSSVQGIAERTPKKRNVDINAAHYEYIVNQLRKRREEAGEAEREELDRELAAALHERRSGSPPTSPMPMSTAFTDRSLRKREGLGSRQALRSEDGTSSGGAATPHSNCGCAVCKPNVVRSAGQMSHSIQANVSHFVHVPNSEPPQTPHTARQKSAPQGRRAPGSPNYYSARVAQIIKSTDATPSGENVDSVDECPLTQRLGIKIKPSSAAGRSLSADMKLAGRYRRKMELDLETDPHARWRAEGCLDPATRHEVAMILSPRDTDPARPTKITSCKKADGDNKYKISQYAEKVCVHWNQPLYRYELASVKDLEGPERSPSQPPEQFLTFPRSGHGSPRRSEGGAGDFQREGLQGQRRSPRISEGREVAQVVNHEFVAETAAKHRIERLASDQRFSDLCAYTEENTRVQTRETQDLKDRYVAKQGHAMANALAWQE